MSQSPQVLNTEVHTSAQEPAPEWTCSRRLHDELQLFTARLGSCVYDGVSGTSLVVVKWLQEPLNRIYGSSPASRPPPERDLRLRLASAPPVSGLCSWTCQRPPKGTDVYAAWQTHDRARVRLSGLGRGSFIVVLIIWCQEDEKGQH